MSLNIQIIEIVLENFIGIYNGLSKKRLKLNFENLLDKEIIIILGDNGTGKSTFSSVLHPLPGTTDKRNTFIREGKEGLKIIRYRRSDGVEYECKLVYSPSKTGHTTKGFIKKYMEEGTVELNPNGNISSYKEILFEELGVSDAILKLASQNDSMKGNVDMTSTERKINMSSFLPEDIWSTHFMIVDKTYKDFKSRMNVLVECIGKMQDEETINAQLEAVTKTINELVEKRDKSIGKIKEYETRISVILQNGDVEKLYSKTDKMVKGLADDIEELRLKISKSYDGLDNVLNKDISSAKIMETKNVINQSILEAEKTVLVLKHNIDIAKSRRNEIADQITSKESILKDISSDSTIEELKDLKKSYESRFKELDKIISKLNTNLSKDDLLIGYDIVKNVRTAIERINSYSKGAVKQAILDFTDTPTAEKTLESLYEKKDKVRQISDELANRLSSLNQNSHLKDVLEKRPDDCKIDNCPFLEDAQKWTSIQKEIEKYTGLVEQTDSKALNINADIEYWEEVNVIIKHINNVKSYIEINSPIINKLPYNEKYATFDKLLKSIKDGDPLNYCDDFDQFIEVLECREEYNLLKYKKIPSIEMEISMIETQGKLIQSARDEVKKLYKEEEKITAQLKIDKDNHETISDDIEFKRNLIEKIDKVYDFKIEHDKKFDEMKEFIEDLKELKKEIDKLNEYEEKLKKRKEKLKEIDKELVPLTRNREFYKMEQLKLIEYKKELEAIDADMYKLTIIRDALSTRKDGIPVHALGMFMDVIRQNANSLLSSTFNGALYLEEFVINDKDFSIPFKKNGDVGPDISVASSSERSFISLCLTLAIMEEILSKYTIMILDEIDRGFSENNKYNFIRILGEQIKRVGISQTFMITHNREYYDGYEVGYILFPGHGLNKYKNKDVIKVYE